MELGAWVGFYGTRESGAQRGSLLFGLLVGQHEDALVAPQRRDHRIAGAHGPGDRAGQRGEDAVAARCRALDEETDAPGSIGWLPVPT